MPSPTATWPGPRRTRARPATSTSSSASCCDVAWRPMAPTRWRPATTPGSRSATGVPPVARRDSNKDQTYSCGCSTRAAGPHPFPLGDLTKPAVRRIASDLALPTADKPESQEICSCRQGTTGSCSPSGAAMPAIGADRGWRWTRVGTHTGYAHYTVGQRHGLGVALGEPVFVREVFPATKHRGHRSARRGRGLALRSRGAGSSPARRRPSASAHRCGFVIAAWNRLRSDVVGADRLEIEVADPVWAPAPGQPRSCMTERSASAAAASLARHDPLARAHRHRGGDQPRGLHRSPRTMGSATVGPGLASLLGTAIGNAIGSPDRTELVRIGDFTSSPPAWRPSWPCW